MANRLANSSSAYLRSAVHQPIDWHEFGEEAFRLAKEKDRPILLDIGAVWCHWCHVIDRESYENEEIASLINEHYIPVKVDRDQRPDVDARYQELVQQMTGQGGWPLTAFLTHDGRIIYGGTYFPPAAMKNLLVKIQAVYHERKAEIFSQRETIDDEAVRQMEAADREALRQDAAVEQVTEAQLKPLCQEFSNVVLTSIERAFDPVNGGFGSQPKFPHFSALEFLIGQLYQNPESTEHRNMLDKTLIGMAQGGIYDQIAGGFHRYSVDDHWHVPHFEKMAYDNAEALKVYAQAYRLTGNEFYRQIAEGIIGWVDETLSDQQNGGFYASQDADIDLHDDGDHFTWSSEELREILTPQEQEVVSRHYDVNTVGDMHHAQGRNVLMVSRPLSKVAEELGIPLETVEGLLAEAQRNMLEKRRNRPIPFVDNSLYTNWNGMLLSAYFEAADLLEIPEARRFAEKTLDRILKERYQAGVRLEHCAGVDGFLEDYAWLALAALKGYYATARKEYLTAAQDLADLILQNLEDSNLGAFFDLVVKEDSLGLLKARRKPVEDNPSSSANAIALQVLNALYALTGDDQYKQAFEKGLNLLIHLKGNYGMYVSALGVAARDYLHPPLKLEVTGNNAELQAESRRIFYPGKLLSYQPQEAQAEVRICMGTRCLAPVQDAKALQARIQDLGASVSLK